MDGELQAMSINTSTEGMVVQIDTYEVDNSFLFGLYRKITVKMLSYMLALYTIITMISNGFDCFIHGCNNGCSISQDVINAFCWVQGTFTVKRLHNHTMMKENKVPLMGIGQVLEHDEVIFHWAYLWVIPYLAVAIFAFGFVPWLWIVLWDGSRLGIIYKKFNDMIEKPDELKERIELGKSYFLRNLGTHGHTMLVIRFMVCEILNISVALMMMIVSDVMFNGKFSTYGWDVLKYIWSDDETMEDPMSMVFPTVTTCHMNFVGPSGDTQLTEALCALPFNIWTSKVLAFLWFWFILLIVASSVGLFYRIVTVCSLRLRIWIFHRHYPLCTEEAIEAICGKAGYGDWFVMLTSRNICHGFLLEDVIQEVGNELLKQRRVNIEVID